MLACPCPCPSNNGWLIDSQQNDMTLVKLDSSCQTDQWFYCVNKILTSISSLWKCFCVVFIIWSAFSPTLYKIQQSFLSLCMLSYQAPKFVKLAFFFCMILDKREFRIQGRKYNFVLSNTAGRLTKKHTSQHGSKEQENQKLCNHFKKQEISSKMMVSRT